MAPGSESHESREDRRRDERQIAFCAAQIDVPSTGSSAVALIHDISPRGALLLTANPLDVGAEVEVKMQLTSGFQDDPIAVHAKVIRADRRRHEQAYVWPWQIAVLFGERIAGLENEIEALLARRRKLGL